VGGGKRELKRWSIVMEECSQIELRTASCNLREDICDNQCHILYIFLFIINFIASRINYM
jgi:hypothetical protein